MKTQSTRKKRTTKGKKSLMPIEVYSDRRIAEFLLNNALDAAEYRRACQEVRQMGLDPAKIDHDRPVEAA